MSIQRATPVNEFLAKLIFLMLPTAGIGYYLLENLNVRFAILHNAALQQSLYFMGGMGIAALLYSFRVRFLPTFALLLIALVTSYNGINNYASGEFDSFFLSVQFQVFAALFSLGWFFGWGYIRLRYFAVGTSLYLLSICITSLSSTTISSVAQLLYAFVPVITYSIYNIFTAEQIYNYQDKSKKFWWFLFRRLFFFGLLLSALMFISVLFMYKGLEQAVSEHGSGAAGKKNSMMKKNQNGTFDLNDYTKLSNSLNRDMELLFCAHIDNYFPGTKYPNPLYLTAFYFTKFDTATETFERDKHIPFNDLFLPDPSKVPLFSTVIDTDVIRNSYGDNTRSIVDVEIYNCKLSPSTFLAPNVGFFVQPITVEKDFREKFVSAYRTKSYVSALNSAYFVYNMDTPVIRKFQEERFKVLREVKDYKEVDSEFFAYYTYMPPGKKYESITTLAHQITDTAHTPVDKVLAIRNYFLSKNENGERLYQYTDNPGEPDIPNASKLLYFLNENHKGYCAYYAGASLFMLRSLGIPSRIAVGFLTEDRADKNKGWYWYYANQAHAWIQVFFPGYGWLDFDNTVGNTSENRPTPQPDGTPPMQPPKAWMAANATVESVDTTKKIMMVKVKSLVYHDKEYPVKEQVGLTLDMKVAVIYKDSLGIPFSKVKPGDMGTVVSYAEALKKLEPENKEAGEHLLKRLPSPTPIDEMYLARRDTVAKKDTPPSSDTAKPVSAKTLLWAAIGVVFTIILLMLLIPSLVLRYYLLRFRRSEAGQTKPYWAYRTACYYLHMVGFEIGNRTPMQYATRIVDPFFGTQFLQFMNVYLKKKYAKQELNAREMQTVNEFLHPFLKTVRSKTPAGQRILGFINPIRMAGFFTAPDLDENGDELRG